MKRFIGVVFVALMILCFTGGIMGCKEEGVSTPTEKVAPPAEMEKVAPPAEEATPPVETVPLPSEEQQQEKREK